MKIEAVIGQNIRRMRLEKGLSQEALATEVGVAARHIGRIERGSISATIGLLARISESLGCCVTNLMLEKDAPMPPNLPRGRAATRRPGEPDTETGWFELTCRKSLARSDVSKDDLDILEKILFQNQVGTLSQAAENMVRELIERAGGEENLTPGQRRNIALARAWAAAKDSGGVKEPE